MRKKRPKKLSLLDAFPGRQQLQPGLFHEDWVDENSFVFEVREFAGILLQNFLEEKK